MIGVLSLGGCGAGGDDRPVVRVSAAASLGPVLQKLRPAFEDELGVTVRLNLAGSGTLTRQVLDGAPADAVILSHPDWMTPLIDAGRVEAGDVVPLAGNALVVVGRGPAIDLEQLAEPRFGRIAIGDPDSVPAGLYAKQALITAGVWDAVETKLVTTADVRAALRYAQAGDVEAAIIYATDAADLAEVDRSHGLAVLHRLASDMHDPITITAATVDGSASGAVLLDWLRSPQAWEGFAAAGFDRP